MKFIAERCRTVREKKLQDATSLGAEEFVKKRKALFEAIVNKEKSYLQIRSNEKKANLLVNANNDEVSLMLESKTGWDIAPLLNGKIRFSDLRKAKHTQDLKTEVDKREILRSTDGFSFTNLKKTLYDHERSLLRAESPTMPDSELDVLAKVFKIQSTAEFAMDE